MENQERFSVMVLDDDRARAYLTTCLSEEADLVSRPLVFHDVDSALQYVQKNCLDSVPPKRSPIPQLLLIDFNLSFKDGMVRRGG